MQGLNARTECPRTAPVKPFGPFRNYASILSPRKVIGISGVFLHRPSLSRAWLLCTLTAFALAIPSAASDAISVPSSANVHSSILIGFVGGFVRHDNPHHGPVQLAGRIRPSVPQGTYIRVFENRRRKQAFETVLRMLDTNRDGILSAEEKARARIVLFGQSWGASAAVLLARDLQRVGVPVLLTVQVDSVAKLWQNDAVIPANVAQAVNFYQPHGIIHGRSSIKAADPAKTQILGNYLTDYKKTPIECPDASWLDRVFTPGHMESECDPRLWSQIQTMIQQRLSPANSSQDQLAAFPVATQ
jgi:pimeloyl-ACP methyl ester carboxylesterase